MFANVLRIEWIRKESKQTVHVRVDGNKGLALLHIAWRTAVEFLPCSRSNELASRPFIPPSSWCVGCHRVSALFRVINDIYFFAYDFARIVFQSLASLEFWSVSKRRMSKLLNVKTLKFGFAQFSRCNDNLISIAFQDLFNSLKLAFFSFGFLLMTPRILYRRVYRRAECGIQGPIPE